nr:hypothetical protein [Tanacetum cinerariifolium]
MIVAPQAGEGAAKGNVDDVPAAGVAIEGAASVNVDDVPAAIDEPSIPSPTPPTQPPPPSQDISSTSQRVKKLERRNKLKVSKLRRLKKVGTAQKVDTSDDTVMDDVSKQGRIIAYMDAYVDVTLKDIANDVSVDVEIKESADVQGRQAESQAQIYKIDLEHADKVLSMQDDDIELPKLHEVVEVVTTAKLIIEVVTAASATITAAAHVLINEVLIIPGQTATGKEISNPFMAESLPKTMLNVTTVSSSFCCLVCQIDAARLMLLDKKKVVIIEATIRDALRLNDAEGIDCLPNEEIFTELARMGYEKPSTKLTFYKAFFSSQWKFLIHTILQCMSVKRTSWNEFSSSMASAIICLSTVDESVAELNDDDVYAAGVADRGAAEVNVDDVPTAVDKPSIPSPTPPSQTPPPSQDIPYTS